MRGSKVNDAMSALLIRLSLDNNKNISLWESHDKRKFPKVNNHVIAELLDKGIEGMLDARESEIIPWNFNEAMNEKAQNIKISEQ